MIPRTIFSLILVIITACLWFFSNDIVELILKQREVLFGKYSSGGFSARLLFSVLFLGLAMLLLDKKKSVGEAIGTLFIMTFSTVITVVLFIYATTFLKAEARYVETQVTTTNTATGKAAPKLTGVTRHRPPNKRYELRQSDIPAQHRSYPNDAPGYRDLDIVLTSDKYGFRNLGEIKDQYPIIVVGDSFAAGSHVSDDQGWTELLQKDLAIDIYNLGVSGSDPRIYLNNYVTFGQKFKPKTVLFMVYQGNDFKYDVPVELNQSATLPSYQPNLVAALLGIHSAAATTVRYQPGPFERFTDILKTSPVAHGYKELSRTVLEKIGADSPVSDYNEKAGWMPLAISTLNGSQFYSFKPKRLEQSHHSIEDWKNDSAWISTSQAFTLMKEITKAEGSRLIMIWAPAKPNITLAAANSADINQQQLHRFGSYRIKDIPDPATFKVDVFNFLQSQETVFMDFCIEQEIECISPTEELIAATKSGQQTYFSYDQHWTPEGNKVVADVVGNYLTANP
jgi:hypothetical protein